MKESIIVDKILKQARTYPDLKAVKTHGNPYLEAGTPDILGIYRGQMFAWEVKKSEKDKPTRLQELRLGEWAQGGASVRVIRSVSEAVAHLSELELSTLGWRG